jgi:ribose/xylose/arabinose/galactoside ABC-type transport system permease subunit
MKILRSMVIVEWSGLLAAIVLGSVALVFVSPNFLTEFNIYVMLRSFCVALLVGFSQMVTLGVGQMNIAVGALGGLVAICFGGMLEVWGLPIAAAAGLMVIARLGAAMPAVGGEEWLLPSFLGPVLGGTLLSGGAVSVISTMLGAALVTTIRSGLLVMQVGNFWLQLFLGVILLLAVFVDRYRGVYSERRRIGRR